jgi:hypothetical protein
MLFFTTFALLPLLILSRAYALPSQSLQRRENGIAWAPCPDAINSLNPFNLTFTCGTLTVPLDYTDRSNEKTISLNLIKLPAAKKPSKGSILFNFGGPGGDGLTNLAGSAQVIDKLHLARYMLTDIAR